MKSSLIAAALVALLACLMMMMADAARPVPAGARGKAANVFCAHRSDKTYTGKFEGFQLPAR